MESPNDEKFLRKRNVIIKSTSNSETKKAESLKKQQKLHLAGGEEKFKCDQCHYVGRTQQLFNGHVKRVHGAKKHRCKLCDYKTNNPGTLWRHEKIHSSERPFKCDKCSYSAKLKMCLIQHAAKHSIDRPFVCQTCKRSFKTAGNLKKHDFTHTGEKPFACDQCPFRCNQAIILKRHLWTHTDNKDFPCRFCERPFRHENGRERHERLKHVHDDVDAPNSETAVQTNDEGDASTTGETLSKCHETRMNFVELETMTS